MIQEELHKKYFEWLYRLVHDNKHYGKLSFRNILIFLHNIEFTFLIDMDENRAIDGVEFRYRFGYENGYSRDIIERYLDNSPCSVLEMMVALAFRAEEQIMDDSIHGDRTGQWFWNMMVSLGLGHMNDSKFNEGYAYQIISRFLERKYERNGRGGLFTIENCPYDLRDMEIWSQFMWYLDDILYQS